MQVEIANHSRSWTFFQNAWHEGNVAITGGAHKGFGLPRCCSTVRAFGGVTPDLDLHCARGNESARAFRPVKHPERQLQPTA